MDTFFNPKSIVVFGVSESHGNLGKTIIENLLNFKFIGECYAIGSSGGYIKGKKILTGLDEIDKTPDLAVILVPAIHVPSILEECGKKGIKHVIIESGGFSEFSEERKDLEDKIKEIAKTYKIKVIGPNCFGVINLENGVILPFFMLTPDYMKKGNVSIISQSGGVFYDTCMMSSCENIGLQKVISIGNKLLINENECLEYLIKDENTGIIGLYLEDFSDGKAFMNIVASSEKPIVLLKANRSDKSKEIAKFHTSALAGDDRIAFAAMSQVGVIVVDSFYDFIDTIKALSLKLMKGKKVGVISRSGGHSVLAADAVEKYGFHLANFSQKFFSEVKKKKLNVIRATNPLDIGDVYDLDLYTEILEMALKEDDVDGIAFIITYSAESDGIKVKRFIQNAGRLSHAFNKPVALSVITNRKEWLDIKNAGVLPIFSDCDRAVFALKNSYKFYKLIGQRNTFKSLDNARIYKISKHHKEEIKKVSLSYVFNLLKKYNLPIGEFRFTKDKDELPYLAESIGYPVVLKNASHDIIHKTDAGGVILNIKDEDQLKIAAKNIDATEYLIQRFYPSGFEIIIGIKFDRNFGHVIIVGFGGIYTEIIKDTSMRILPISDEIAEQMIEELKGSIILKGFRGKKGADIDAIKNIMVGLSNMILENPYIHELDLNPVIVYEKGYGAVIVDARMSMDV
ncbi:MAG TPA: acetate--CoA ligase family protein [Syntrophorhabdaceae bacterium]|nr:acetate--CoA ligase family protein [Syntrophorhabdaceae bacterium]